MYWFIYLTLLFASSKVPKTFPSSQNFPLLFSFILFLVRYMEVNLCFLAVLYKAVRVLFVYFCISKSQLVAFSFLNDTVVNDTSPFPIPQVTLIATLHVMTI